jgi:hypothetical protein
MVGLSHLVIVIKKPIGDERCFKTLVNLNNTFLTYYNFFLTWIKGSSATG